MFNKMAGLDGGTGAGWPITWPPTTSARRSRHIAASREACPDLVRWPDWLKLSRNGQVGELLRRSIPCTHHFCGIGTTVIARRTGIHQNWDRIAAWQNNHSQFR
ncbi:MAG: hypothetical protein H6669_15870 [Ardenticatenaceae bacterium]|nr:hypothetical protein [Ardenticatenaceae bacterium]